RLLDGPQGRTPAAVSLQLHAAVRDAVSPPRRAVLRQARRQSRLLRPLRRGAARHRCVDGRPVADERLAVLRLERSRRDRVGDPRRAHRVLPRRRGRNGNRNVRPRRGGRSGDPHGDRLPRRAVDRAPGCGGGVGKESSSRWANTTEMTATTPSNRTFLIDLSPDDGLVRIKSADTGRVTLALSLDEASQLRAGLKEALQPQGKKRSKKNPKR